MFEFRPAPWVWVVAGVVLGAGAARPDEPKKPAADPAKALIDRLTEVSEQDLGYSGSDSGSAFLPLGRTEGGPVLLSPRQGAFGPSDALRSLVKLGVKAVPALLDHLADDRKTKIELSHPGGFGGLFVTQDKGERAEEDIKGELGTGKRYTVRVGDLCYVALGQIVNRDYTAVRYVPTAIVSVTCVPKSKKLRAELVQEWGGLTADRHRDSLVQDFDTDRDEIRIGAPVRLGYFYPDALEAVVLEQLARPAYDGNAVEDFLRDKLYPAKTAKERKELADGYVTAHGEVARDGIRWLLFNDLDWQIADEEGRMHPPSGDRRPKARECLIDVFGYTGRVTLKDRPKNHPPSVWGQRELIDSLRYDRSAKIDRAVRDFLAKTGDRDLGRACLNRLVGRGCDADIETYLKRLVSQVPETDPEFVAAYTAKLGWTRLHAAVELDVTELIETALKDRVDVNARARDGRTALHLAAADGKLGAVELVLAAKADPNVKDGEGKLAVQLAAHGDHPSHAEVVRRLVAAKSVIPDALTAATVGDADRLAELLKADPTGVTARTEYGLTPLHVAAREGHEQAAGALIAAGADVTAVDVSPRWGNQSVQQLTPLHAAAMAGRARVAKLLLDKGAEVNATDLNGKMTALHYAAANGHVEVVRALLAGKADRAAKDENGRTPLDLAEEREHAAVVKLLGGSK